MKLLRPCGTATSTGRLHPFQRSLIRPSTARNASWCGGTSSKRSSSTNWKRRREKQSSSPRGHRPGAPFAAFSMRTATACGCDIYTAWLPLTFCFVEEQGEEDYRVMNALVETLSYLTHLAKDNQATE